MQFFFADYFELKNQESKIKSASYSIIELKAGIKNLQKFGYYNQIKSLMKSLNTTKENVLNTSARECILDLIYESEVAIINNKIIDYTNKSYNNGKNN